MPGRAAHLPLSLEKPTDPCDVDVLNSRCYRWRTGKTRPHALCSAGAFAAAIERPRPRQRSPSSLAAAAAHRRAHPATSLHATAERRDVSRSTAGGRVSRRAKGWAAARPGLAAAAKPGVTRHRAQQQQQRSRSRGTACQEEPHTYRCHSKNPLTPVMSTF
jgi:hypothetical protein